ncbi:hypothetical protein DUNSADRAFT_18591 [Dunaliella salina]|uniref:DUF3593 domain-containing protein n=1 Tax=Dunaliella salina TaxID=3046 RepID=A0ABQ7FZU3_DUNSA|nr:hypothetical protein DUNSADRAFT_18591 [Dunaliella salina]|eukprot:KAF5827873.1 hypothetical protein DUNSADRAFT_18591 [Dunaliella salina]
MMALARANVSSSSALSSVHKSAGTRQVSPSNYPLASSNSLQGPGSISNPPCLAICSCAMPFLSRGGSQSRRGRGTVFRKGLPFDQAWAPSVDVVSLAPQFFAASLFPYLAFLYFLHSSGKTPKVTLFGFYFLLAFVFATIPAGIYAKVQYGTNLANVDWLHGTAESLLTITNLLIVLGLRKAIREETQGGGQQARSRGASDGGQDAK